MDFQGKKIAVLGLGKDGLSLVKSLAEKGAQVAGFGTAGSADQKEKAREALGDVQAKLIWEPLSKKILSGSDLIVFSSHSGRFQDAREFARDSGVPVFSDLDFIFPFLKAPVIAVTGTNGKTTTLSILKMILERDGKKVTATGGDFDEWGERISDTGTYDYHLLELSSTRLENSFAFKPYIAILTNIFPAHEGRHEGGLPAYLAAKAKIYANQDTEDYLVHEASAGNIRELIRQTPPQSRRVMFSLDNPVEAPGAFRESNQLIWLGFRGERDAFPLVKARNKTPAFLLNFMAALAAARLCGVSSGSVQYVLEHFEGLPHRLQEMRELGGVKFIDDSRSTNIGATLWSISSFSRPIWLIMGGALLPRSDFSPLNQISKKRVKGIFLLGSEREVLAEKLAGGAPVFPAGSLKEALEKANRFAAPKDVVLFSPACPPDLLTQGEGTERGDEFRLLVLQLPEVSRKAAVKTPFSRI